jgi:TolA-binding protein
MTARRMPLRLRHLSAFALAAACASAPVRPTAQADELKELRAQLGAQSALVAQQQRRIEELEVKLAALAARSQLPAPAAQAPAAAPPPAAPQKQEPRPQLKTVKLGGRKLLRADRVNPVERAPRLPDAVALREPDEDQLARLQADPEMVSEFDADHAWSEAVQKLNQGRHAEAETDLLAFVAAWPRHSAADNALYLAGLVRESRGDCNAALPLFESVPRKYPAGDAVPQALLERGRCLLILGRKDEAKTIFHQLEREHPDAPETAQGLSLIKDL